MSVSPTVSQLYGRGRHRRSDRSFTRAVGRGRAGIVVVGVAQFCEPIFHALDVNADLIPGAMGVSDRDCLGTAGDASPDRPPR